MSTDPIPPPTTMPADDLAEQCRRHQAEMSVYYEWDEVKGTLLKAADELDRLQREVKQLGIEKDALVRAATDRLARVEQQHRELVGRVDAHVAASVWEDVGFIAGSTWTHGRTSRRFDTRAEAEADYRERTGLHTKSEDVGRTGD